MDTGQMNRRHFLRLAAAGSAALVAGAAAKIPVQKEKTLPNILLILTDDIGYGDCPVYNPQSKVAMPNVDRLARRGMLFTDAHSPSAVCAPTRYSVLTGNYPWRGRKPFGTWNYNGNCQILDDQKTIGQLLKPAGYHTAMFGKLHTGGHFYSKKDPNSFASYAWNADANDIDFSRKFRRGPTEYGFDYSFLLLNGVQGKPYAYFENDQLVGDPKEMKYWEAGPYGLSYIPGDGVGMPYWDSSKAGPDLTKKTIEFIENHYRQNQKAKTNKPFFIHYCSQAIHVPHTPPQELMGTKIKDKTFAPYLDMLWEADVTLGKFIDTLEKLGLLENTLIIFTSDNGAWPFDELIEKGHFSNGNLRGWKGQVWEGGHRVPFIAAWGDGTKSGSKIAPGSKSDEMFGLQDLYATFAEVAGQKVEKDQGRDSISILPAMLGTAKKPIRKYLVVQANTNYPHGKEGATPMHKTGPSEDAKYFRMIREGDWKLIVDDKAVPLELFNLKDDLQEKHNLVDAPAQAERVRRMTEVYKDIMQSQRSTPAG